ncbi:hypothetical protein FV220_22245 [Methylobacterium sp. WL19]|nr:hypothetical protein FV220_22245 [Methylobacterium sp. WL19]
MAPVRSGFSAATRAQVDGPIRPPHPEVPASAGLEGGLQMPQRSLEGSFEAAPRHLRMRFRPWINYSNMLAADDH